MDKIAAEIVLGALVLSMVLAAVPLFRNNIELVSDMAAKSDGGEKIREALEPEIPNGQYIDGSYLISLIRFYAAHNNGMRFTVYGSKGSKEYRGTDYDENDFKIYREKNYFVNDASINGTLWIVFFEGV